jgi:CelD/BcsL family acetyltransferase involved in cellulose biosynthesis
MYGVPVRRLRLIHNDHTPRTDIIMCDRREETYLAVWHAIQESPLRWDVLQLSQLPGDSPTRDVVRALASADRHATGVWESGAAPYLDLPATIGAKLQQNVRNRLNRLSQIGEPRFEVLEDRAAIAAGRDDAQRLEESGWKQSEGTAIASDPAVQRFYALLMDRAPECPWLRLLFLSVNGRRIAASVAAIYGDRLFLLKTGYDPGFAKCSPFKVLTWFAMRHACEAGLTQLDFLGDAEPWKLEWTPKARPHDWLFVFAGTPRGRLLHPLKFQVIPAIRACTSRHSRA